MTNEKFIKGHNFIFIRDNSAVTGDYIYKCRMCNSKLFHTTVKNFNDLFVDNHGKEMTDNILTCNEVIIKNIIN